jgi:nucleotide-binding universal stress UspA family protein
VMATHGHSGLAHLILGSTAEKVAQYVKKPVLTVRPEGLG